MQKLTEAEALAYIRKVGPALQYPLDDWAVRGDDYIPRKRFRASFDTPDGVRRGRLPGVCAISVAPDHDFDDLTSLPDTREYGRNRFLLLGRFVRYGDDPHEVILADHKIIAIVVG